MPSLPHTRHSEVAQFKHGPHGLSHGEQPEDEDVLQVVLHGEHGLSQLLQRWPNSATPPIPKYGVQPPQSNVFDRWVKTVCERPLVRAMLSELLLRNCGVLEALILSSGATVF